MERIVSREVMKIMTMVTNSRIRLLWIFVLSLLCVGDILAVDASGALDRFVRSSGITPSATAVLITDLETGNTIVAHNGSVPLVPASIMKAVTSASLLSKSRPDRRYITEVYSEGSVKDGVLDGNITIIGSGDPTIGTDREPFPSDFIQEIADALKEKGIRSVKGKILIDNSCFTGPSVPPSWSAGDLKTYYGTGVHGFNFGRNASGNNSVADPSALFLSRLTSRLALAGIKVEGDEVSKGRRNLLLKHVSPPMEDIMRSCMMRSDNMYAECMLRTFSLLSGGNGDVAGASRMETEFWKKNKAPMEGVEIIDGSGLSRSNRVTARFMEHVLQRMNTSVEYASFFPLAGQEGTLKKFLAGTDLEAYVAMKTGSMKGIQCYAGYVLDDDFAPTHTVVFIMNSLKDRGAAKRAAETLLLDLFSSGASQPLAPDDAVED